MGRITTDFRELAINKVRKMTSLFFLKKNIPDSEQHKFESKSSWIDPELVSVWEIEDGRIRGIQDKDNIISENYFDIKMTALTDEYFQILNYYQDEE